VKVSGFTIIRNAIRFDFPVVEAIQSILPICDEFVVAVGESEDGTLDLIQNINSRKIRIIETVWDENLIGRTGEVLASETNKALQAVSDDTDWAFYIQSDEIVHEDDLPVIQTTMGNWKDDQNVDGLLFQYLHFYGSYEYLGSSPHWYSHEIRIVRKKKSIYSYRDAQGFRKGNDKKLGVHPIDARIYHYGWVRHPSTMQDKRIFHMKWAFKSVSNTELKKRGFDYSEIDSLEVFTGTHPVVMQKRINGKNWSFKYDLTYNRLSIKNRVKQFVKRYFGIELGYKNYRLLR